MAGRHRKGGPEVDDAWAAEAGSPEDLESFEPSEISEPFDRSEPSEASARGPVQVPEQVLASVAPSHVVPTTPSAPSAPAAPGIQATVPRPPAPFAAPVGTGSAAEADAVLPQGASARRVAREEKRRKSRRTRIVAAALVVLLVGFAAVGAFHLLAGGGDDGTGTQPVVGRPQTTLLLQVVDANRQTVAAVLLAHDTRGQGSGFGALVPSALAVDAPGSGAGTFGSTSVSGPATTSATALSDVVDVTVDGTWVLDAAGLASLVDRIGGVDVDVDRDVTVTVAGGTQTLASAGHQHLSGSAAAAFATFLAAQEPEQTRLARFSTVLAALLPKLPAQPASMASLMGALAGHSSSTDSLSVLGTFLGGLRADAVGDRLGFDTLPTHSLDLGTGTPTLLIDPAGADTMMRANFGGSLPVQRPDGPISVVIQNGVGTPGLGIKARSRLVVAGITYVNGGNAGHFGYAESLVLVPSSAGSDGQAKGLAVAKALGLPAKDVALTDQGQTIADVVVILGADFKP